MCKFEVYNTNTSASFYVLEENYQGVSGNYFDLFHHMFSRFICIYKYKMGENRVWSNHEVPMGPVFKHLTNYIITKTYYGNR